MAPGAEMNCTSNLATLAHRGHRGVADLELAIGLDHRITPHERGYVGVVRDFEEDPKDPNDEGHHVELLDTENIHPRRYGNRHRRPARARSAAMSGGSQWRRSTHTPARRLQH